MHAFGIAPPRPVKAVYGQRRRQKGKPVYVDIDDVEDEDQEDRKGPFRAKEIGRGSKSDEEAEAFVLATAVKTARDDGVEGGKLNTNTKVILGESTSVNEGEVKSRSSPARKSRGGEASTALIEAATGSSLRPLILDDSSLSVNEPCAEQRGANTARSKDEERAGGEAVADDADSSEDASDVERAVAIPEEGRDETDDQEDDEDDAAVEALVGHLQSTRLSSQHLPQTSPQRPIVADSSLMSQGPNCLLEACRQNEPIPFSDLLDTLQATYRAHHWRKIGEASYSEVFSMEGSKRVIKVIPLKNVDEPSIDDSRDDSTSFASSSAQLPERSYPRNVRREIAVTRTLCRTSSTFVKLHNAFVARGPYPRRLLRAWDHKQHSKKALNIRPDVLPKHQLYSILVLSHGGRDLEAASLSGWKHAASLFCQVVRAISDAERSCHFEHRDLHWGNIVVRKLATNQPPSAQQSRRLNMQDLTTPKWSRLQATIIDFTLARAEVDDAVTANPFDDEAFFTGKGDLQFDVYRRMRDVTRDRWKEHHPRTNALWLHYLLTKLLYEKGLEVPPPTRSGAEGHTNTDEHESKGHAVEVWCHALLLKMHTLLDLDLPHPETRARFASAGHVLRQLATTVRGLS